MKKNKIKAIGITAAVVCGVVGITIIGASIVNETDELLFDALATELPHQSI